MLFNIAAAIGSINIFYRFNSIDRIIHRFYEKAVFAMHDQLWHATLVKGNHWSAAGHGLYYGQAERLIEIYGMQKRVCLTKQLVALTRPDAADIDRIVVIQMRFNVLVIVGFILNDSGQNQFFVAGSGNFKGLSGTLVLVNASEE